MGRGKDSQDGEKAQAVLRQSQAHRRGTVRLGSPTTPERARQTADKVRQTRPLGSSDWVEVRTVNTTSKR